MWVGRPPARNPGLLACCTAALLACGPASILGSPSANSPPAQGPSPTPPPFGTSALPVMPGVGSPSAMPPAVDPVTGQPRTSPRMPAKLDGIGADPGPNPATSVFQLFDRGEARSGCSPELQSKVARTPLRRLTREQYDNTVRDLFAHYGVTAPLPGRTFSPDDYAGSFPANAGVVASERHIRAYADAAEHIASEVTPQLERLVPCEVANADAACARDFVVDFATRAYRHPVEDRQLDALLRVYELGAARNFTRGIALVIEAVLQSPNFLYHVEYTDPAGAEALSLDAYELAARLSYFLWNSLPDDALFELASSGTLTDPDVLRAQAQRMFEDPRAEEALAGFTTHWLELEGLADLAPDNAVYPGASLDLPPDALKETLHFVDHVLRGEGDGTLTTLLTAQYGFPTRTLWPSYGLTPPADYDGSTPIELPSGQRAGVLTQVSTLFKHSHTQLSPIRRGKYVLNSILCQEITFPENVEIDLDLSEEAGGNIREKLEGLTKRGECAGCHNLINPIGFAFDGYNMIGQYRSGARDEGALNVPDYMMGPARGAVELAERIAQSDAARSCIVKQMHRYALRRREVEADTCSLNTLARSFAGMPTDGETRFDVRRLMLEIVAQNSFRFQGAK